MIVIKALCMAPINLNQRIYLNQLNVKAIALISISGNRVKRAHGAFRNRMQCLFMYNVWDGLHSDWHLFLYNNKTFVTYEEKV